MQLRAFDSSGQLVHAQCAVKQKNYHCPECQQPVRLRGGPHRQFHFYHLETTRFCRQHQKGLVHLQLQSHFLKQLPLEDCRLELPFPTIGRIADVAWLSQKIVFEIQCSPISAEEVMGRNKDYGRLGWTVIWILHEQRFNQVRLSAAEIALRNSCHFFTNMDQMGNGMIYDQFDINEKGWRRARLPPLQVNLKGEIKRIAELSLPIPFLERRINHWKISLTGDLIDIFLQKSNPDYLQKALATEKKFQRVHLPLTWDSFLLKIWNCLVLSPYQIAFRFFLERMCR